MKKIIDGKSYNTETAVKIGRWDNGKFSTDFDFMAETLYKKRTGEYFIHGDGGARTCYSRREGVDGRVGCEDIDPISFEDAQEWARKNLTADEYEAEFGIIGDDETASVFSCRCQASTIATIRREASKRGCTVGQVLDEMAKAL